MIRRPKCGNCPLSENEAVCLGQRNQRACHLNDPAHPDYQPHNGLRLESGPSIAQKALNLAGAIASHVAAGMPVVTPETKEERLAICQACPEFEDGRCRKCGCGMAIKAEWADQSCPLGKWGRVDVTECKSSSETH